MLLFGHYGIHAQGNLDLDSLFATFKSKLASQEKISNGFLILDHYDQWKLKIDTFYVDVLNETAFHHWRSSPRTLDSLASIAHEEAIKLGYEFGRGNALFMRGFSADLAGNYDNAHAFYFEALEIMERVNAVEKVAIINDYIGIVFRLKGEFDKALKYYLKALRQYESIGDSTRIGNSLNSLGNLFIDLNNFQEAEEYFRKSLSIKRRYSDSVSISNTLGNLSYVLQRSGNFTEAEVTILEVIKIKQQNNDLNGLSVAYMTLGRIFEKTGRFSFADSSYRRAINIDRELGALASLSGDLRQLADLELRSGKFKQADKHLDEAIALADSTGALFKLQSALYSKFRLDSTRGDFKGALEYFIESDKLHDSLYSQENTRLIAFQEAEYEFEKRQDSINFTSEKQRLILEAEIERQGIIQWISFVGLIVLFIIAGIIYYLYQVKIHANKKLQKLYEELNTQKQELISANETKERLFSVISHDLRSPMTIFQGAGVVIKDLLKHEEYEDLINYANHIEKNSIYITQLLDNLLNWALEKGNRFPHSPEAIPVKETVESSLTIFKTLASLKSISILTDIPSDCKVLADKNTFTGIIRNLVNNALKFTEEGGKIMISVGLMQEKITISIQDTGVGIAEDKLQNLFEINEDKVTRGTKGERGTGLGLNLVDDFVKMNNGDIKVESILGKGTTFIVTLDQPKEEVMI